MTIAGSEYVDLEKTTYGSNFTVKCKDMYELHGNSSHGDQVVRCQADRRWDFGDIRCNGMLK